LRIFSHNKSAHNQQEEKQEERGSCQTLINIPLRSMLINAGVPLKKDLQPYQSERSFNKRSSL